MQAEDGPTFPLRKGDAPSPEGDDSGDGGRQGSGQQEGSRSAGDEAAWPLAHGVLMPQRAAQLWVCSTL